MRESDLEALPRISVLIGTRNRPEVLKRCLRSVLGQDYVNFEVLVLDDASDSCRVCDSIQELADPRLRCFRASEPLGVAGGRNRLMELAEGNMFFVMDDDAYLDNPFVLSRVAEVFSKNPDVGIVAVKVIDHRGSKTGFLLPFPKWALIRQPSLANEETDVSYFLGTGHAIRREVVEVCGPYQPDLIYGEEELDLSYRVVEAGFRIRYVPDIIVHHYPQDSVVSSRNLEKNPELYYHTRNRVLLAWKYLPLRFMAFYIAFWMLGCWIFALRSWAVPEWGRGILAGVYLARETERTPLSRQAIRYLRKHYGRLWY